MFASFRECNGAIISKSIILTTAHCVKDPFKASSKINDITVLLGDSSSEETIKIVVESFLVHPDYSNVTFENNMALLQLSEEIKFNELICKIKPIHIVFFLWEKQMALCVSEGASVVMLIGLDRLLTSFESPLIKLSAPFNCLEFISANYTLN